MSCSDVASSKNLTLKRDHSVSSSDDESGSAPRAPTSQTDKHKTSSPPKKVVKKQKLLTSFATVSAKKKLESPKDDKVSVTGSLGTSSIVDTQRTNADGKPWNFKISSWNVAGIRAWVKKNGMEYIKKEDADIVTLQEVKCPESKLPLQVHLPGYYTYWVDSEKSGYAGVGLYSKTKPLSVVKGLGIPEHDTEGRVITAEYQRFYLVAVYVPNAGAQLKTLPKRLKWDEDFQEFLCRLNQRKPVILVGDLNVAHQPPDLARPDTNANTPGFTQQERDSFSAFLGRGFVDTFRYIYPTVTGAYTFWAFYNNARERNTGWRIDYFVMAESLLPMLCDSVIRKEILGSDHCPITLYLAL